MAKPPPADWSMQKLRVSHGDLPEPLTFIVLPLCRRANSGQVWQVMRVRGRTLHCMVMPADHDYSKEPDATYWNWYWISRRTKRLPR